MGIFLQYRMAKIKGCFFLLILSGSPKRFRPLKLVGFLLSGKEEDFVSGHWTETVFFDITAP